MQFCAVGYFHLYDFPPDHTVAAALSFSNKDTPSVI